MESYQRIRAQMIYLGMIPVGLYMSATETFADGADWQHRIVGPLIVVAFALLFWFGLRKVDDELPGKRPR
jgi:uncharacterized membrane protein